MRENNKTLEDDSENLDIFYSYLAMTNIIVYKKPFFVFPLFNIVLGLRYIFVLISKVSQVFFSL